MAGEYDGQLIQALLGNISNPLQQADQAQQDQAQRAQALQAQQFNAIKIQAAQQDQKAAEQYDVDVASYLSDPTATNLSGLIAKYPQQHQALAQAWKVKTDTQRQTDLSMLGSAHAALANGRVDLAVSGLTARRDAERAAGMDTSHLDEVLGELATGDPDAIKAVQGGLLAEISAGDPDKFYSANQKALGAGPGEVHVVGKSLVDDKGNELFRSADEVKYETVRNGDGTTSLVAVGGGGGGATSYAGSGEYSRSGIRGAESQGDDNARNSRSSAQGRYQIVAGTAAGLVRNNPAMFKDAPRGAGFTTWARQPEVQERMMDVLEPSYKAAIASAGAPVNATTMYTMHLLGTGTGAKLLAANPNASVRDVIRAADPRNADKIISGNGRIFAAGNTVADTLADLGSRVGGGRGGPSPTPGARVLASGTAGQPKPGYEIVTPEQKAALNLDANTQYQRSPQGKISPIGGQPKPGGGNLKTLPPKVLDAIASNNTQVRTIDRMLKLLDPANTSPEAKAARYSVGPSNRVIPSWVTQFTDSAGEDFRSQIGRAGGIIIKDVSGAAVSASEDNRLARWVPLPTDSASAARVKLQNLRRGVLETNKSITGVYGPEQGYRPYVAPGKGGTRPSAAPAATATPAATGFKILKVRNK